MQQWNNIRGCAHKWDINVNKNVQCIYHGFLTIVNQDGPSVLPRQGPN